MVSENCRPEVSTRICSFTTWRMSRSPVTIRLSTPSPSACRASVASTSSASKPSAVKIGMFSVSTTCLMRSICVRSSSGMRSRWPLYSGNISCRNVLPTSKATATYSGCWSRRTLRSIDVKPNTAFVSSPSGAVRRQRDRVKRPERQAVAVDQYELRSGHARLLQRQRFFQRQRLRRWRTTSVSAN